MPTAAISSSIEVAAFRTTGAMVGYTGSYQARGLWNQLVNTEARPPAAMGHLPHQASPRPRSGLPIESPFLFYSRYAAELIRKAIVLRRQWRSLTRIVREIESDPHAKSYMDAAFTPVAEENAKYM